MISANKIFIMMLLLFAASRCLPAGRSGRVSSSSAGCALMHTMVYIHDKQNHHVWSVRMNESFHFITGEGKACL